MALEIMNREVKPGTNNILSVELCYGVKLFMNFRFKKCPFSPAWDCYVFGIY